jgi:hypothetical protein
MEEQPRIAQQRDEEPPPSGIGQHSAETLEDHKDIRNKMPFKPVTGQTGAPTHLSFGTPTPPKLPLRTSSKPAVQTAGSQTPQQNRFGLFAEQGSKLDDMESERLCFGSLSGAYSRASSAKNTKGREPSSSQRYSTYLTC